MVLLTLVVLGVMSAVRYKGACGRAAQNHRRRLLAMVKPPGVGPATTMFLTGALDSMRTGLRTLSAFNTATQSAPPSCGLP